MEPTCLLFLGRTFPSLEELARHRWAPGKKVTAGVRWLG